MLTDIELANLMSMTADNDAESLKNMLSTMTQEDKAYFKGYVAGYAEAVRHMQMDSQGFAPDEA